MNEIFIRTDILRRLAIETNWSSTLWTKGSLPNYHSRNILCILSCLVLWFEEVKRQKQNACSLSSSRGLMLPVGGVDISYGGATWLKNSGFLNNWKVSPTIVIYRVSVEQKFEQICREKTECSKRKYQASKCLRICQYNVTKATNLSLPRWQEDRTIV